MRSSTLVIALIVAATALVVAPPPHEWSGRPRPAAPRTTLLFTVWGMDFEDLLFRDRYARGFEHANPGVAVDYRRYGSDLIEKYNAWHAAGTGADVMRLRITDYPGMAARGMLEPLTPSIERAAAGAGPPVDLANFPPAILDRLWIDGDLFALPEDNAQYGLFYNRAIFDAHNAAHPDRPVPYPTADWTWEDLRAAARTLAVAGAGDRLEIAGLEFAVWSWPFLHFHAQAGGDVWSADGLACTINGPAGVRALEFLRAMQRDDRSLRVTAGRDSPVGPDALFAAGRTAMFIDGSWRVPNLERVRPDLDFAVVPPTRGPAEGGRPAVVSGSVLWGISSKAKDKAEAFRFLAWLVADEQAADYWDALRVAPPANLRVLASPSFRSTRGIVRAGGAVDVPPMPESRFGDRAAWLTYATTPHPSTGRPPGFVPLGPYQTELEDLIHAMLEEWLRPTNQSSAQAMLDDVVRSIHAIIDRDRAARGLPPVVR